MLWARQPDEFTRTNNGGRGLNICGFIGASIQTRRDGGVIVISCGVLKSCEPRPRLWTVTTVAGIDFKAIRDAVTVRRLVEREGMTVRGGRVRCPWCATHDSRFNFKLNADGSGYCFACHKAADAIDTAAQLWHTDKLEAARLLNSAFHLGLEAEAVNAAELERRRRDREAALKAEAEARAADGQLFADAADELRVAEAALERFTTLTDWTPALTAAVKRLAAAQDNWSTLWASMGDRRVTR